MNIVKHKICKHPMPVNFDDKLLELRTQAEKDAALKFALEPILNTLEQDKLCGNIEGFWKNLCETIEKYFRCLLDYDLHSPKPVRGLPKKPKFVDQIPPYLRDSGQAITRSQSRIAAQIRRLRSLLFLVVKLSTHTPAAKKTAIEMECSYIWVSILRHCSRSPFSQFGDLQNGGIPNADYLSFLISDLQTASGSGKGRSGATY